MEASEPPGDIPNPATRVRDLLNKENCGAQSLPRACRMGALACEG